MTTAKQIAHIIRSELLTCPESALGRIPPRGWMESAAEKIAALTADNGATVAAATLENEVTSTLMDMTVATVLATLIEEEGGGRANISISPMSMDHMMKHYTYAVTNEGLIRNVSIALREDSDLNDEANWRAPSNRHGVMHQDESAEGAKPQAEEHVHDRPLWAVRVGENLFAKTCRADAERTVLEYGPVAVVENRHCLHTTCPASGCNQPEVASDKA